MNPHIVLTSAVFPTTSTGIAFAGVCVGEDIGILDEQCQDGGTGNATAVLGAWVVMGDQKSKFGYAGATNKATATVMRRAGKLQICQRFHRLYR